MNSLTRIPEASQAEIFINHKKGTTHPHRLSGLYYNFSLPCAIHLSYTQGVNLPLVGNHYPSGTNKCPENYNDLRSSFRKSP